MLRLCLFISAVICSANLYAQQATPSPAVRRILEKTVIEVRRNRQAFDEANQKPLGDARTDLRQLSTKLIQDGKTVDATAVLKQIETLDIDVARMANAPAPVPVVGGGARVPPQKPLLERLAGRWGHPNLGFAVVIDSTGAMQEITHTGKVQASGRLQILNTDTAEARLSNGYRCEYTPAGEDRLAMLVWEPSGKQFAEGRCLVRSK